MKAKTEKIYIYCIYFPTSNRPNPDYIGVAGNLDRRMFKHLRNKSLVGNALQKYADWQVTILHICKTYEEAFRLEIEEIRKHNCIAPNGYNLTAGGEGLNNPSKETIEKMRKPKSEEAKQNMRKPKSEKAKANMIKAHQGKHHSEKTKEKNRQAHTGKHHSEKTKANMRGIKKPGTSKAMRGKQHAKGHGAPKGNKNGEGYKHTEKWKQNHSKAMTGKHWRWPEKSKEKRQGNQNAKGNKHSKKANEKNSKRIQGNQNALKNGKYTKEVKIKKLQTRIAKLEQELKNLKKKNV